MQQRATRKLKPFKNYYCEALPCGIGKFYNFKKEDEEKLSPVEVKTLCEMAIAKNAIAGVKEIFLKLPYFVELDDLFEKYGLKGKIVLPATQFSIVPTKALVGDKLIIEIESFVDLNDNFLNDLANFVGDEKLEVLINLGDNLAEVGKVVTRFNISPTELAESYGFLDRKCYVRGLNHVDKDDLLLLKNYDAFGIITPRDDGQHGRGFINNYNLTYNDFLFGFGSGGCYNIDMLAEGKLSSLNTSNLMSEGNVLDYSKVLDALSCERGEIEVEFDSDALGQTILDEKICLGRLEEKLIEEVKKIAKKLKEKN